MKQALVLLLPLLVAATISGTVYDLDLTIRENSIVRIDTKPSQVYVARNGTYSFTVPNGEYTLTAEYEEDTATEQVEIRKEGTYLIDLILGPELLQVQPEREFPIGLIFAVTTIILAIIGWRTLKMKKISEDLQPILDFLKQHEGRATQAEIVKNFPQSEAKTSLMLTELEHSEKIKKIKKGRGNIIIAR